MSVNSANNSRVYPRSRLRSDGITSELVMGISTNVASFLTGKLGELDLTQTRFAELMGVSQATVHTWLTGEKWPRDHHFDRMKEQFGWSYEEMVRDRNSPDDPVISFMRDHLHAKGYQVFKKSPLKR